MAKEMIVTGLDLGTSKVSAVAARIDARGAFSIVAHVSMPSKGMDKGAFFDLSGSVDVVSKALKKIRSKTARRLGDLYVNISGEDVRGATSRGMIPLVLRGREVTRTDISRCIDVAGTVHLPFDREIVHSIVQNFSVDDQPLVKNPLGLYASRLACEVYILTAGTNHIQNIHKCASGAGYDVKEVVFSGVADGAALLDAEAREKGALILDMGASLTELTLFQGGELCEMGVIPVSSADCSGDFAELPCFKELIERIKAKLSAASVASRNIGTLVLTGGMAFEDRIVEVLEERLGRPVKMGLIRDIQGEISGLDGLRLATAIGLCRYAYEQHKKKAREERDVGKRLSSKVVDLFNRYF